jgi:hypothetical protein
MSYPNDTNGTRWFDRRQCHQLVAVYVVTNSLDRQSKREEKVRCSRMHPRVQISILEGRPTTSSLDEGYPQSLEFNKD